MEKKICSAYIFADEVVAPRVGPDELTELSTVTKNERVADTTHFTNFRVRAKLQTLCCSVNCESCLLRIYLPMTTDVTEPFK